MGNVLSTALTGLRVNSTSNEKAEMDPSVEVKENSDDEAQYEEARAKAKEEEMNEFKKQLSIKREQRKEILTKHRTDKEELEKALEKERKEKLQLYESNKMLRELLITNNIDVPENLQSLKEDLCLSDTINSMKEEFNKLKTTNNRLRVDLVESNRALQDAFSEIADLNSKQSESRKQIKALKDVVTISKTMMELREQQLTELRNKLSEIEQSLAEREVTMLSTELRNEYERQLQNIRTLRGLYEERARLAEVTKQGLLRELGEQQTLYQTEVAKCNSLTEKVEELEKEIESLKEEIQNKNYDILSCQDESRGLKDEMSVVNKLFSQVLLGYKTKQDLDKLIRRLEENHGLLTQMAEKENGLEASTALPKLLLELVSQVDDDENNVHKHDSVESEVVANSLRSTEDAPQQSTSAEEIVENLPKVWRVLMELLSHHNETENIEQEKVTTCYKSIETKTGSVLVPSVSQTYIRLKDLIVEKLSLVKEVNRMKQLNTHLESRLEEQERRLCLVTSELTKTWHVVGRLRKHHHQLHTHEKILKYELQQKRKLLNELKEELEYCREKWEQAREKNNQSEKDWRKLRAEFSSRRNKSFHTINTSAESGYSDERPSDESSESNDESEYIAEPLIRSKKKLKKSFETIPDSSADFNLAAEREDPASDMLDVADLPLDNQDGEENNASTSENSENIMKNDRIFDETEDEICDIANDSCNEDTSVAEHYCDSDLCCVGKLAQANTKNTDSESKPTQRSITSTTNTVKVVEINPAEIIKSVQEQNERLARKESKLQSLERSSEELLKKTKLTVEISDQISTTLDHILNRPSTSEQLNTESNTIITQSNLNVSDVLENQRKNQAPSDIDNSCPVQDNFVNKENKENTVVNSNTESDIASSSRNEEPNSTLPNINLNAILESIKKQNERLAKKEQRLQNLENGCNSVVSNLSNTLDRCDEIIKKLDTLRSNENEPVMQNGEQQDVEDTEKQFSKDESVEKDNALESNSYQEDAIPTSSNELSHTARFAARDLRLKRLEEQTKSLVNKMSETVTKGVKINYKLEELHNIYVSESSRAGTPADDGSDEASNENEEDQEK